MNIPFILKFINKIELFQILNKLDKQFILQVKELKNDNQDKNIPLWEAEKKILYWTYKCHKHLGSPLMVISFRSKKSNFLKSLNYSNAGYKEVFDKIKDCDPDIFEQDFKKRNYPDMNSIDPEERDRIIKNSKNVGNIIYEMKFTANEIERLGVRKIFGNLVSRGYAKFYPELQKEISHWESEGNGLGRAVYEGVITTQNNCDGIIITQDGMLMGELLNDLFKPTKYFVSNNLKNYKKNTGADYYLRKKIIKGMFYWFFILIGWLALVEIVVYITVEFLNYLHLDFFKNIYKIFKGLF